MKGMGHAIMGIGTSSGEHRAVEAAQQAIASPLLEETSIEGARGLLINITGGTDITLSEINDASDIITQGIDADAQVLFGAVIDESLGDSLQVTVIATGFHHAQEGAQLPASLPLGTTSPSLSTPVQKEKPARRPVFIPQGPGSEYGINIGDDIEIPAILRKQMD